MASEDRWDISICGLNCAVCDIYMASHGDEEKRRELVDWFKKEMDLDVDIVCDGCRGSLDRHWSPDCVFLPCAREKGVDHCFECAEFPCAKVEEFREDEHDHHRRTVENMERMREMGLEAWIEEQRRRGQCFFCP
jgi:hypothetical protein